MKRFHTFLLGLHEALVSAYHESLDVQPGKPFKYIRNTQSAKHFTKHLQDDPYGQKVEPHGRYMQATTLDHPPQKGWEQGEHTFHNPLYIHWGSGGYKHDDNWKNVLHSHYKKKGRALSKAIIKDGYDGIVTVGKHGNNHHTSEIVDLTSFK